MLYVSGILCITILNPGHCMDANQPPPLNSFTWKSASPHRTSNSGSQYQSPLQNSHSQLHGHGTTYDEWKSAEFSLPQMKGLFYRAIGSTEFGKVLVGEAQPCDYLKTKGVKLVDHLRVSANNGM